MLNERDHIIDCLDAFAAQNWPSESLDVMVIDGGSTDGSRDVVNAYRQSHPWVRVVDNPRGSAAGAFNVGMHQAAGEVVCLFSSHGVADPTYVSESVRALEESGAAGVGGEYRHTGQDRSSSAIGLAMVSRVGMASPHRHARFCQEVDTISHPAYLRDAMLEVGEFDESLARNSDYEFNYRMRRAGFQLVFDPAIGSVYRPRPGLRALARQFWMYGRWKQRVVENHPGSLRLRHLVAPGAVVGAMASPFLLLCSSTRRVVVAGWLGYAAVVLAGVVGARPRDHDADPLVMAAALPVMHGAWGAGFVTSVVQRCFRRRS